MIHKRRKITLLKGKLNNEVNLNSMPVKDVNEKETRFWISSVNQTGFAVLKFQHQGALETIATADNF